LAVSALAVISLPPFVVMVALAAVAITTSVTWRRGRSAARRTSKFGIIGCDDRADVDAERDTVALSAVPER
jgi:hypothetical protein